MLVVASNVGIGDGSLLRPPGGAVAGLVRVVQRAAARGGFGPAGHYRPITGLDVVFAGDTFDWLVSSAWCAAVRPWHRGVDARETRARVAQAAVRRGGRLVAAAAAWARRGIGVPAADARGRPHPSRLVHVPVRVVALAGDRDPWLDEAASAAARHGIVVGECWTDGNLLVRHGHEFDPACRRDGSAGEHGSRVAAGRPTLAESVAVDLVARFGHAVRCDFRLDRVAGRLVRSLAASRVADVPRRAAAWLASAAREPEWSSAAGRIDGLWRDAVAAWHRAARGCVPGCDVEFDVLDDLAAWLEHAFRGEVRAMPVAIGRLGAGLEPGSRTRAGPELVLGHGAGWGATATVIVSRGAGGGWESLAPAAPEPPVVTIGPRACRQDGDRIVDAA